MASHIGRRKFLATLGGAAAAWPLAARAQQPERMRRIGVLMGFADTDNEAQSWIAGFREELRKLGWTEDRNMARPGGNVTGFTPIVGTLGGKWVELLKEVAPRVARVILVFNPAMATFVEGYLSNFKAAAASLGVEGFVAPIHDLPELESVVAIQAREPNSGLVVIPDAFTVGHRVEITLLAARYRVPAVYWSRSFAELGGLISYGPDVVNEYRRAASYADRILKGAQPSELPVQSNSSW
jgi:ABC-type uncharacterized transport system substrate-binding protein